MESFKFLLEKLDITLQKYIPVKYQKLQQPLEQERVDQCLKILGIDDENFRLLYNWKNGFDSNEGEDTRNQIFNFGGLVSMEYIIEHTNHTDNWEKTFFPIESSGDGDFILFNKKRGKDFGKLHLFSAALLFIDSPISYYDSIYSMIQTCILAYEQRIFKYDSVNDFLDIDSRAFRELACKINPLSDYWKKN